MGRLTTHVLDTANGKPGAAMALELFILQGAQWKSLKALRTNADGRTDAPLLEGETFAPRPTSSSSTSGATSRVAGSSTSCRSAS